METAVLSFESVISLAVKLMPSESLTQNSHWDKDISHSYTACFDPIVLKPDAARQRVFFLIYIIFYLCNKSGCFLYSCEL